MITTHTFLMGFFDSGTINMNLTTSSLQGIANSLSREYTEERLRVEDEISLCCYVEESVKAKF